MADITMCQNNECPKRKECYRFTATPSPRQSYSEFATPDGKCAWFIQVKK